jgi:ketosteroid isomerase-like protein
MGSHPCGLGEILRLVSRAKVDLARRYFEALNTNPPLGDPRLRHPDWELFDPPEFPDAGCHVGESAAGERVAGFKELGWDGQYRVEEFVDAGDEVVVVWKAMGRSAHGGGAPIDMTLAHVLLFEEGKVRRIRQYLTRAEGVAAAGLSE